MTMELIYFFGRLHVLLLHLPIGILLLAVVLEIVSRQERFRYLQPALGFVWAAGALSAIGTAAMGYMHASEGGFAGDALDAHRLAGTSLAVLACAIWVIRAKAFGFYGKTWSAGSVGVVLLLFLTGHFGGNLTHGDTYLAEYAPRPLRGLLGREDAVAARPKPASLESADIYLDVVQPSLQQRCATCHNENKRKGEFSVATYADLMKGGKDGVVIVAGKPEASDLIRRISLDPAHEDFMPKDGKPPLTAEQGAAIAWWISVGAPRSGAVATLTPTPEAQAALASVLGFSDAGVHQTSSEGGPSQIASSAAPAPAPDLAPADPGAVNALESSGFVVRPIAKDNPLVQVDYTAHRNLTDADMAALARIGPQIYSLNLRDAGMVDRQLETIGKFQNLAHLRLELNPITDTGVAQLQSLGKLEYLNLYGTKLSDKGIAQLARLEKLRDLFVWQTSITTAGIAELKRTRADLNVNGGFDPRTFPVGPKVIPVVN